eukprot:gene196-423_t
MLLRSQLLMRRAGRPALISTPESTIALALTRAHDQGPAGEGNCGAYPKMWFDDRATRHDARPGRFALETSIGGPEENNSSQGPPIFDDRIEQFDSHAANNIHSQISYRGNEVLAQPRRVKVTRANGKSKHQGGTRFPDCPQELENGFKVLLVAKSTRSSSGDLRTPPSAAASPAIGFSGFIFKRRFELTSGLNYVVPFSLAVISAKWVGDVFTDSIYECHAVLKGFAQIDPEIRERGVTHPILEDIVKKYDMPFLNPETEYSIQTLLNLYSNNSAAQVNTQENPEFNEAINLNKKDLSPFADPHMEDQTPLSSDAGSVPPPSLGRFSNAKSNDKKEQMDYILVAGRLTFSTQVYGVIRRKQLVARLNRALARGMGYDTPCGFFGHPLTTDAILTTTSPLASPNISIDEMDSTEVIEYEMDLNEIDLDPLLKTNIAVLTYDTPLLTAYCVFEQHSDFNMIVATAPRYHTISKLAILTRDEFFSSHVIPAPPDSPSSRISFPRGAVGGVHGAIHRTLSLVSYGMDSFRETAGSILQTDGVGGGSTRRSSVGSFAQFDDIDGDPEVVRSSPIGRPAPPDVV